MNTLEQLKIEIANLKTAKQGSEAVKSASAAIAKIAYEATISNDTKALNYVKTLEDETKKIVKGPFSKGCFVGNKKLDKAIPKDMENDAILTIYNKMKKLEKANEAAQAEVRLASIRENQALQLVFEDDKEALNQFLKENDEDSETYKNTVNQGLAIMAEQEKLENDKILFDSLLTQVLALNPNQFNQLFKAMQTHATPKKKSA